MVRKKQEEHVESVATPVVEVETPVIEVATPATEVTTPVTEVEAPIAEVEAPIAPVEAPIAPVLMPWVVTAGIPHCPTCLEPWRTDPYTHQPLCPIDLVGCPRHADP